MTTIQCNFKNSISQNLDGYILVGLDGWLMKDGETSSYTPKVGRVEFVAGSATLELAPSELEQVTYSFEVWYYDEVTTSDPETGEPVITTTELLLIPKFYARVPDSATPILFNDLAKQSGINRDNIDTAISAIVRRLYNEDVFWTRLQENLFVAKGTYSATAWYSRGDVVTWDGGSYLYYYSERSQNVLPSTTTHWQKLADRGATGTGITGNDTPLDPSWNGQTDAPTRNAVYDALQLYALGSTVAGLAPLNSPAFTGSPTRTTAPAASANNSELPTTAWVQTLVATVQKAIVPIGTVVPYAGLSAPVGWVFCLGQQLSQTTYSALYAIVSTAYNTGGETAGNFRVPDLRGRVVAALDNAAGRLTTIGATPGSAGGAEAVTLTVAQLPSHTHPITSFPGGNPAGGATGQLNNTGSVATGQYSIAGTNTASAGSGNSHNNVQPTICLNYIIYTGL